MGSLRVRHDWATSLSLFIFMHWRRKWQPTPVFLPGESQGRRSLVGCCLWGVAQSRTWLKQLSSSGREGRDAGPDFNAGLSTTWGFSGGSDGKESACNVGDLGSIPGLGRSSRDGNRYPLQYSCLENTMDRGDGGLQSLGSQKSDRTERRTYTHTLLLEPIVTAGLMIQCLRKIRTLYIALAISGRRNSVHTQRGWE